MSGLQEALAASLKRHLEGMKALRNANFDPETNQALMHFGVLEYLDPVKRECPTKYRVQIRGVAIGDMIVRQQSLTTDFQDDLGRFVAALAPKGFEWEPSLLDPLSCPTEPPIEFRIYLPTDPMKSLAPDVYFTTKIWHPNIRWDNGQTCYGSKQEWGDPTRNLADLVRRIYTMIAYLGQGSVNAQAEHYLNPHAGAWYEQMHAKMPELFPLASRMLA